jgi:putative DNA primase/helicase
MTVILKKATPAAPVVTPPKDAEVVPVSAPQPRLQTLLRPSALGRMQENGTDDVTSPPEVNSGVDRHERAVGHERVVEPWADEVDGDKLLGELVAFLNARLILPLKAGHAIALWVVHTYALDASQVSPILAITSPEKRCGKSSLLSILAALVNRPLIASNMTPASVFRSLDKWHPTLLVDEAETFLDTNELRGIYNAGHTRVTANVVRCVGDNHEPKVFSTWSPKVVAKIGSLTETLDDRSIEIRMRRKKPTESVVPIRRDRLDRDVAVLCRKIVRWVSDNLETLNCADPEVPKQLNDRAQDNWRPLLAIADVVAGNWPIEAREAAVALSGEDDIDDASAGVQLLADIRAVFENRRAYRLTTSELLQALTAMEERPWNERRLSARALSRLLKPFDISPRKFRDGDLTPRGYERAAFNDAFERYLVPASSESGLVPDRSGTIFV